MIIDNLLSVCGEMRKNNIQIHQRTSGLLYASHSYSTTWRSVSPQSLARPIRNSGISVQFFIQRHKTADRDEKHTQLFEPTCNSSIAALVLVSSYSLARFIILPSQHG